MAQEDRRSIRRRYFQDHNYDKTKIIEYLIQLAHKLNKDTFVSATTKVAHPHIETSCAGGAPLRMKRGILRAARSQRRRPPIYCVTTCF